MGTNKITDRDCINLSELAYQNIGRFENRPLINTDISLIIRDVI